MIDMQLIIPASGEARYNAPVYSRERLEAAYLILSGIPEDHINLGAWRSFKTTDGLPHKADHCNTIACGAGWLMAHPDMKALGLGDEALQQGSCVPKYIHNGKLYVGLEAMGRFMASTHKRKAGVRRMLSYGNMGNILFSERAMGYLDEHIKRHDGIVRSITRGYFLRDAEANRKPYKLELSGRDFLLARLHYAYHHMSE